LVAAQSVAAIDRALDEVHEALEAISRGRL
jgi:hypothetical protein